MPRVGGGRVLRQAQECSRLYQRTFSCALLACLACLPGPGVLVTVPENFLLRLGVELFVLCVPEKALLCIARVMVDKTATNARRYPYEHHEYRREVVEARKNGTFHRGKDPQLLEPYDYWLRQGPWPGLFIATGCMPEGSMPHPPAQQQPGLYTPWHGFKIRWGTDETFYTSFIPEANPFDDPVFEPLSTHQWSIVPLVNKSNATTYGLPPNSVNEWQCLEHMIVHAVRIVTSWGNLLLPADYLAPRAPSTFGYHRQFTTIGAAKKIIGYARASFILWGALLSYQIARLERNTLPMPLRHPRPVNWEGLTNVSHEEVWPDDIQPVSESWHRMMEQQGLITPDLIGLLKSSWICDFRRRRIGCFIDLTSSPTPMWLTDIRHVTRVAYICITFWFYYGEAPEVSLKLHLPRALYEVTLAELLVNAERERAAVACGDPGKQTAWAPAPGAGDPCDPAQIDTALVQRADIARGDPGKPWKAWSPAPVGDSSDTDFAEPSQIDPAAPEPNANTRQRRGEGIDAFMAREKAYVEMRLAITCVYPPSNT
ncbi:hypothetical protein PsYK624_159890 [Phanerochaete sordida]|uniref:Uncharacterized protein n=1 Tax=Phanerochaete sordida TaxID=48140 RepID=A0A9P3LLH6_9APHY|nr:hypothetical protein PsYK624_159890 [Phanerochaete sordida]